MTRDQIRKHLELEKLSGADFLPAVKKRSKKAGAPEPPKPKAPDPPAREGRMEPRVPWLDEWREFEAQTLKCAKCRLHEKRTQVVFGVGSLRAPLMFIGEGPGEQEDLQGEPFVGRAGQLPTKTLQKLGVNRAQVYITNIVKCRPPGNRTPQLDEVVSCMPYPQRQIRLIGPKVICALGSPATKALLNTTRGITGLRGKYHEFNRMKILPAFHPAYVLRNMRVLGTLEADLGKACRDSGLLT
ncbi:MAG: uracil-DNA glycosylase [Planctomycetota bacterium]|jgi:DNA polymerase